MDELSLIAGSLLPDAICIVESWLSNEITDFEISINGYVVHRLDRNRHGGGVLVYIKDKFLCKVIPHQHDSLEIISFSLHHGVNKVCFSLFYRPPGSPAESIDALFSYIQFIQLNYFSTNYVLLGDFNINFFSDSQHPLYNKLNALFVSLCLCQVVTEPTRTSVSSSTMIDLVALSLPSALVFCSTISPLSNSDHFGLHLRLLWRSNNLSHRSFSRAIWRYNHADWNKAQELLDVVDLDSLLSSCDVNQAWLNWKDKFLSIMYECIPRALLPKRNNRPWLTKDLLQAMRERNSLYKQAKITGNFANYKRQRNMVVEQLRLAKKSYFLRINADSAKSFWKACRLMYKQPSTGVPVLSAPDGTSVDTNLGKAELLNEHFVKCFNTALPPLVPPSANTTVPPEDLLCSEDWVFNSLVSLDVTKSSGPDEISAYMLKHTAASISSSITTLFNKSLSFGCVPTEWKLARVTPVPKVSKPTSPDHFRPISLLSILSKILEKHVCSLVRDHLASNSLLSDHQWGFRPGRSTTSALLSTLSDWHDELDNGNDICAVFFDYRKAFDSVPHSPLVKKLMDLNIDPFIITWITSYLCNRKQSVVVSGETSNSVQVVSGVPQGSVLGPLLFCIYIDSVTHCVQSLYARNVLYADDLLLYKKITCAEDLVDMQQDVLAIEQWSGTNHLTLNSSKCKVMVISRKKSPFSHPLYLNGVALDQVSSFKYLGITISHDLTWSTHIGKICGKARQTLGLLYRQFYRKCDSKSLLKLYISLVRPHLEYACSVWAPHTHKNILSIERVQMFGVKMISGEWNAPYSENLNHLGLVSLERRRLDLSLCLLFKYVNSLCFFPEGIIAKKHVSGYNLRTSHPLLLEQPFSRTKSSYFSFIPHSISIWNSLPSSIVCASSFKTFKCMLYDYKIAGCTSY